MARIVVIEDDGALRHDIVDRLEDWGHSVAHAGDIIEGKAVIEKLTPDFILCDVHLPSGSGFSLFNNLRDTFTKFHTMKFIFMTSIADPFAIHYGISSGADAYIVKPIDYSHLKAAIDLNINQPGNAWASKLKHLCKLTA